MAYEDPGAAHSAGGFYNSTFLEPLFYFILFGTVSSEFLKILMGGPFFSLDYDMRGYKINVTMAEKSAPRAPPAYDHRLLLYPWQDIIWIAAFCLSLLRFSAIVFAYMCYFLWFYIC